MSGVTKVLISKSPLRPIALAPDREATALAIGQEQASITELLAEHPVLRLQVFDDVLLVRLTHPAMIKIRN